MEISKQRPKSILKSSPSPKPDTNRKGIRFSDRNEVIPIPRSGQPEEMSLKTQDIIECLDNSLRKLEKALNELRAPDQKVGFLKSVQDHALKLGLGTPITITEKATAIILQFFHQIKDVKAEFLKKGEEFLFVNDYCTFRDALNMIKDESNKEIQVVLHVLYSKLSRLYHSARIQYLKKSDLSFNLFLYAHGVKLQDKAWHNLRIVNALIGNDFQFFKQELDSKPDLVWQLEPDDTFFSLILASLQLKRHPFLQLMLESLPPEKYSMSILKELLYAGLKFRNNHFIWKKIFEHQFKFVQINSGLDNEDLFLWVPEGECHVSLVTSGQEILQAGQIDIKTFKQGENLLFELTSSAKERPLTRSIFIKKKEGKNKIYRKSSYDQFEEVASLEQLQSYERAFQLVQDLTKSESNFMKNFTCISSQDPSKKKMEVATNFFGFESSKLVSSKKSLKHRVKYSSAYFKGSFSTQSPLWNAIERPDDLMSKVNTLKASPFGSLEGFRCAVDDAIENKYISVVNRVLDVDTPNIDLQNYQRALQLRGVRNVDLSPSVWAIEGKKDSVKEGMSWFFCRKLICLSSVIFPELIGYARIASGLENSFGIESNLTNFKLKIDRDDRTEVLLVSKSVTLSRNLNGPEFKLVELQNTLPISTLEATSPIVIPRFSWKSLRRNHDDSNSDLNDSLNNKQGRGGGKQNTDLRPLIQTPISKYLPMHSRGQFSENTNLGSTATQNSENSTTTGLQTISNDQSKLQKPKNDSQGHELLKNKFMDNR